MKNLIPPISLRTRDREVSKLLRRGQATDDELFAAQFREWPVRGLNKDTLRDGIVTFSDYWKDPTNRDNLAMYLTTLGYVDSDTSERQLYLNRLLLSPLGHFMGVFSTNMTYARLHDIFEAGFDETTGPIGAAYFLASLWSSYRYAICSSLVQLLTPSIADTVGHEHIHVLQFKDNISRTPSAGFSYAAEEIVEGLDEDARKLVKFKQGLDSVLSLMPRGYYSSDHEIQARLHNLIVQGYPGWGRIPQTEAEFDAAMRDRGLKTPKLERKWLDASEQVGLRKQYFKLGRTVRGHFTPPSAEINIGLNSHQHAEVLDTYWTKYLPSLYADLLVLYGDSQGHSRMGFDNEPMKKVLDQKSHFIPARHRL